MSGLTIQVQGLNELMKRLEAAPEELTIKTAEVLSDGMNGIATDAKSAAPVNYGFLKNSIGVIAPTNNGLTTGVEAFADYAGYVEFGTGTHVEVSNDPEGLPEYALTMKGKKQIPGMYARPYFFPAVRRWKKIMMVELKKVLEKI